jgi:hypothetical protein
MRYGVEGVIAADTQGASQRHGGERLIAGGNGYYGENRRACAGSYAN